MTGIELYSTTAANNNSSPPNGWPEGMAPSGVNDSARQMMAAIRTWYETAEWINYGHTPTYIGATSFSVATDLTTTYQIGRRIKAAGTTPFTIYGTITNSAYASVTTVTVSWDSGSLDGTLTTVSLGINTVTNPSIGTASIKSYVAVPFTVASASGPASLAFAEDTDNGAHAITLKAPASVAANADVVLPGAAGTLLSTAAAVTVAQGGTGLATLTAENVILGDGTNNVKFVAPGSSGNVLTSNGTTWTSAAPGLGSPITNSLSGDVTTTTQNTYYDGPSVAQGSTGTWFASGTVTVLPPASGLEYRAKLWDGSTVIASLAFWTTSNSPFSFSLSGYLASPAGNLRISVTNTGSAGGSIKFNSSGDSKDSTISAFRIA